MEKEKRIKIFDTTLRDGEQSPGASLNTHEKVIIAKQLVKLGVDIIEAGFPISSEGDFEAIKKISKEISEGVIICVLARTLKEDIDKAWKAIQHAQKPRIHTFIATSDIHTKKKLGKTRDEVKEMVIQGVEYAKSCTDDVEFSLEDATRTDLDFMCEIADVAIKSGATTINIPDTVGYSQPDEFAHRIKYLFKNTPSLNNDITISVHCHDDLGNAVANSLVGIKVGATQVECTINGLGERAGNAPLEEIVMNLEARADFFNNVKTRINTTEIFKTSKLVSQLTGIEVQRNKAIVGGNAFAHEAGIHQHGILKSRETYEIISPEKVGWIGDSLVIGKHSGKHAIRKIVEDFGYSSTEEEIEKIIKRVKELADKQKIVSKEDIAAILSEIAVQISENEQIVKLEDLEINTGNKIIPKAKIVLTINGNKKIVEGTGIGPIDALSNAVGKILESPIVLKDYKLRAVTSGTNALADATITLVDKNKNEFIAKGIDEDVIIASAKAIIDGVNKTLNFNRKNKKKCK